MRVYHIFLVTLVVCLLMAELVEAKRNKEKNKKRRGNKKDRNPKADGAARGKRTKHVHLGPFSCSTSGKCVEETRGRRGGRVVVGDVANTTVEQLEDLGWMLDTLLRNISSFHDMSMESMNRAYSNYAIKELNPTSKLRLSVDKKLQMLGESIWWVNWMKASVEVLDALNKGSPPLVPSLKDNNTTRPVSLRTTLQLLNGVQRSLEILWQSRSTGPLNCQGKKSPFRCQKVKVMTVCPRRRPTCSEGRKRAFIILRDVHRGVRRMGQVWRRKRTAVIAGGPLNSTVFYECGQKLCDLQKKRCKQCLQWDLE